MSSILKQKLFDLRYHSSKVEFFLSFYKIHVFVKTNSFVCFLEEFTAWKFSFEINWTLSIIAWFYYKSLCVFKTASFQRIFCTIQTTDYFVTVKFSEYSLWLLSLQIANFLNILFMIRGHTLITLACFWLFLTN